MSRPASRARDARPTCHHLPVTDDEAQGLKRLAAELEANVQAVRNLPRIVPAMQRLSDLAPAVDRIAGFGSTLDDIAADRCPRSSSSRGLEDTLDQLARVAPALEELAGVGDALKSLARVVPTLESLDATIGDLKGTLVALSETIAPLQGTTQRLGRVMDRIGPRRHAKESGSEDED